MTTRTGDTRILAVRHPFLWAVAAAFLVAGGGVALAEVVNAEIDLGIVKTASAGTVEQGQEFSYQLDVVNNGPSFAAAAVYVVDALPAGVEFVSADAPCTYEAPGHQVECLIGLMFPGDTATRTITVRAAADATGTLVNTALVENRENPETAPMDTDPSNDHDDASTVVLLGSIGDTVWQDTDGDGTQDSGEPGIPGVVVAMEGDGIDVTAVTDAGGNYLFADLAPGDYDVTVDASSAPEGFDPTTTESFLMSLDTGEAFLDADFGFAPPDEPEPGRIVVRKVTEPTGDPTSFSFTADYATFDLSDGQAHDSGDLTPGTYAVTETVPSDWTLTSATCDDGSPPNAIVLSADEVVTCTFTNMGTDTGSENPGRIIVRKVTEPAALSQVFAFAPTYGQEFTLGDGEQHDSGDLVPGTYAVTETVPSDWTLTSAICDDGSPTNTIVLSAGEVVTCTFTNTGTDTGSEDPGRIVVEKVAVGSGSTRTFSFTASYGPSFTLRGGQQRVSGDLDPGTYAVTEAVPAGWRLTSATCDDASPPSGIVLSAGETVTCVFTNTFVPPQCDLVAILADGPAPGGAIDADTGDPLITTAGDQFVYHIAVKNTVCSEIATDVVAELTLDPQLELGPLNPGCSIDGGLVLCEIGTVPANDIVAITVGVAVREDSPQSGALASVVFIRHSNLDKEPDQSDNREAELTAAFGDRVNVFVLGAGVEGTPPPPGAFEDLIAAAFAALSGVAVLSTAIGGGQLPATGINADELVLIALAALLAGTLLVALTQRYVSPRSVMHPRAGYPSTFGPPPDGGPPPQTD